VVEENAKELGLTGLTQAETHRAAILAAVGAKKVAAVAAAVRTCQFMDRWETLQQHGIADSSVLCDGVGAARQLCPDAGQLWRLICRLTSSAQ
jgi:hypothetical protein